MLWPGKGKTREAADSIAKYRIISTIWDISDRSTSKLGIKKGPGEFPKNSKKTKDSTNLETRPIGGRGSPQPKG